MNYDTTIKDIAGLKDYSLIFNILEAYFDESDSTDTLITDENEFDIRTSKTRNKVNWAVNKSILQFVSEEHKDLASKVFQRKTPLQDKKICILLALLFKQQIIQRNHDQCIHQGIFFWPCTNI